MSTPQPSGPGIGGMASAEVKSFLGAIGSRVMGIAAVLGIAVAAVAFRGWLEARDDRMRLEATLASQGTIIAAAQKREQDRAQELADTLKQIADLKQSVQTPQQVIREIPQFLPQLPQPIESLPPKQDNVARTAGQGGNRGAVVSGASGKAGEVATEDVRVPAADLKPLFDYVQDCRACQAKLASAQQDLRDEQAKSAALTTERDSAVKAAKGGGFWRRSVRAAKWLAVGFAVGYVAHAAAH